MYFLRIMGSVECIAMHNIMSFSRVSGITHNIPVAVGILTAMLISPTVSLHTAVLTANEH